MQGNISSPSNKQIPVHFTKYIVCCFIVGSLLLVSGCSALDTVESVIDSTINTSSIPSTGQDSNVSPSVIPGSDAVQSTNTNQNQDTGETSLTIRELLDLITPLHIADAIEEYFNQYYTIVGEINGIGVDGDRGTIILEGPSLNGMSAATLFFDPPPDGFENLQKGQVIKIKGYLDGSLYELMVHLYFLNCELIAVGPSPEEQRDDQNLPNEDGETPQNNVDYDELTKDSPNLPVNMSEPFGYYVKEDGVGGFSIEYVSGDDCVLIKYYIDGFPEHYRGQWIESTFSMYCDYIDFSTDNVLDFIDNDGNSVIRFDAYESYITITAPEPIYGVPIDQLNGNYYCKLQSSILQ